MRQICTGINIVNYIYILTLSKTLVSPHLVKVMLTVNVHSCSIFEDDYTAIKVLSVHDMSPIEATQKCLLK